MFFKEALRQTISTNLEEAERYASENEKSFNPREMALNAFNRNFKIEDRLIPKNDLDLLLNRLSEHLTKRFRVNENRLPVSFEEYTSQTIKDMNLRLRDAFNRSSILPKGQERTAILTQAEELVQIAQFLIFDIFQELDQDFVKNASERLLNRNLPRIDDPLTEILKRPLNEEELNELHEKWLQITLNDFDMIRELPIDDKRHLRLSVKSQVFRVASKFHMEWALMYHKKGEL